MCFEPWTYCTDIYPVKGLVTVWMQLRGISKARSGQNSLGKFIDE